MVFSIACLHLFIPVVLTVMMDGTEDCNGIEMEAVVLRYWNSAIAAVTEHVIAMDPAFDRSAQGLMGILIETLEKHDIEEGGLVWMVPQLIRGGDWRSKYTVYYNLTFDISSSSKLCKLKDNIRPYPKQNTIEYPLLK